MRTRKLGLPLFVSNAAGVVVISEAGYVVCDKQLRTGQAIVSLEQSGRHDDAVR